MPAKCLVALALVALFLLCSHHRRGVVAADAMHPDGSETNVPGFDIVQRTCALEVVLAMRDIDAWRAIDSSPEVMPMHLDSQPGQTMLACLPAPTK